ncbi:MAG TPA: hypothetical protein VE270_01630 [Thermoleophilaceae bacterium]|nr:hypothetical protein [Thermoleophilaceae bacterium]
MSALPSPEIELVELETPIGSEWEPVVRMVLGGIADRLDLGFDELDDLQLAVERLLAEAGAQRSVRLAFELASDHVRTRVGPLREAPIAAALQGPPPAPGELGLRRVLDTVVDSFGVEESADGELFVRLEKRVAPR